MPERPPPELPSRIGRYRIRGVLGRGGMGVVYRARDPVIDRGVAIKLIHPRLLEGGEAALALFRDEARAAGRCRHPNIIGLFDAALHEGRPFLVMELVEGEDLAAALRRAGGRLAPGAALAVTLQLLEGLQAAHAQGVVHRDLKPSNLLLGRDGLARLSDFGIARLASAWGAQGSGAGGVAGTPSYMAPEQCRGAADARSDLFSAGVLLQEMLTGTRPFPGDTPAAVMQAVQQAPPLPLPDHLPAALREAIARALSKDPAARFASAAAMAAALRDIPGLAATALPALPEPEATLLAAPLAGTPAPSPAGIPMATPASLTPPPATLQELQQILTRYVGPIASYLVRQAARREEDAAALCASLADAIAPGDERERFRREAAAALAAATPPPEPAPACWSEAELQRLRLALAQHLGPVAGLLVRRGAAQATSLPALWQAMARQIEAPEARAAFLREAPP